MALETRRQSCSYCQELKRSYFLIYTTTSSRCEKSTFILKTPHANCGFEAESCKRAISFITFSHLRLSALSVPRTQDLAKLQTGDYNCQEGDISFHLSRPVVEFASCGLVVINLANLY